MEMRNFKYNKHGTIDLEIDHPVHGWIPFTANPDDPDEKGKQIYTLVSSHLELVQPYEASDEPE